MSELLFEYKVRARHRLGWKEFSFYATTDIEEFLNRNSIDYVRNMTDTVEHRQLKEIERLNNIINRTTKYVQSLSSSGRGCDIYEDIKQEILKELKGVDKE